MTNRISSFDIERGEDGGEQPFNWDSRGIYRGYGPRPLGMPGFSRVDPAAIRELCGTPLSIIATLFTAAMGTLLALYVQNKTQ